MSITLTKDQNEKKFQKNLEEYSGIHEENVGSVTVQKIESVGQENNAFHETAINFDLIYARQDQLALQYLHYLSKLFLSGNPEGLPNFLDVGSRIYSAAMFATVARCFYLEPRMGSHWDGQTGICDSGVYSDLNMTMVRGEAQHLPFSASAFPVITSLHAIEHFGLGRYGDSIDPLGDIRGLREMYRVLMPGGYALFSVPVTYEDCERIIFDRHRLYSPERFNKILKDVGFEITDERHILTSGQLMHDVDIEKVGSNEGRCIAFSHRMTPDGGTIKHIMERIDNKDANFAYFVLVKKSIED